MVDLPLSCGDGGRSGLGSLDRGEHDFPLRRQQCPPPPSIPSHPTSVNRPAGRTRNRAPSPLVGEVGWGGRIEGCLVQDGASGSAFSHPNPPPPRGRERAPAG